GIYVTGEQHGLSGDGILEQQSDHAHIGTRGDATHGCKTVAERCVVGDVDGDGLRYQQSGKAIDLHLERAVGWAEGAGYNGTVESPLTQDDSLGVDCLSIGCAAGRTA